MEFDCRDCGRDTLDEYYIVNGPVWFVEAGMCGRDMLCIGCLERRIGRKLVADDFTDAPLNWSPHVQRSKRLQSRLDGKVVPAGVRDPLAHR